MWTCIQRYKESCNFQAECLYMRDYDIKQSVGEFSREKPLLTEKKQVFQTLTSKLKVNLSIRNKLSCTTLNLLDTLDFMPGTPISSVSFYFHDILDVHVHVYYSHLRFLHSKKFSKCILIFT